MKTVIEIDKSLLRGKEPTLKPIEGTWIAGGAIRQWFVGNEKSSDIDFFAQDEDKFDLLIKHLESLCGKHIAEKEHAISFLYRGQLVQAIKFNFRNVQLMFDEFDFNVCQFAWDGTKVYSTLFAITSVMRGHLGVSKINKGLAIDSLRRAFKYTEKGYKPCNGTLQEIARSMAGLNEEQIKSQVTVSPGGGSVLFRID